MESQKIGSLSVRTGSLIVARSDLPFALLLPFTRLLQMWKHRGAAHPRRRNNRTRNRITFVLISRRLTNSFFQIILPCQSLLLLSSHLMLYFFVFGYTLIQRTLCPISHFCNHYDIVIDQQTQTAGKLSPKNLNRAVFLSSPKPRRFLFIVSMALDLDTALFMLFELSSLVQGFFYSSRV